MNSISPTLIELFECELQASAAGYPGAQEDIVTYTQIDLVLETTDPLYEQELIDILLRKKLKLR